MRMGARFVYGPLRNRWFGILPNKLHHFTLILEMITCLRNATKGPSERTAVLKIASLVILRLNIHPVSYYFDLNFPFSNIFFWFVTQKLSKTPFPAWPMFLIFSYGTTVINFSFFKNHNTFKPVKYVWYRPYNTLTRIEIMQNRSIQNYRYDWQFWNYTCEFRMIDYST